MCIHMLSGQHLADTAYVMQTCRGRDTALRMITKYLPFLDWVHCHIYLAITRHGDFCDVCACYLCLEVKHVATSIDAR